MWRSPGRVAGRAEVPRNRSLPLIGWVASPGPRSLCESHTYHGPRSTVLHTGRSLVVCLCSDSRRAVIRGISSGRGVWAVWTVGNCPRGLTRYTQHVVDTVHNGVWCHPREKACSSDVQSRNAQGRPL
ncbi:hypothetical protein N7510_006960 [Penicillium lagena]|uniref:uncharacterized protein n=1 Tax=Penicillium lagena TaxID=94218 RepID=UPI0025426080|nr:uncharacterized protein N7510_006960 [Penicillium lagena]KAJ5610241.1 hypothetical protein N7510_006960 [Penicillium lagena]